MSSADQDKYSPKQLPPPTVNVRDRLKTNEQLLPGQALITDNGLYRFEMERNGNVTLWDNTTKQAIWTTATMGQGGTRFQMTANGNAVLWTPDNRALWVSQSVVPLGQNPYLILEPSGNVVIFANGIPIWQSATWGGTDHGKEDSWLSRAISSAGKAIGTVSGGITGVVKGVIDLHSKIPIVGPGIEGLLKLYVAPLTYTDRILQGERIDRATLNELKVQIAATRQVAPYAQTVISFVPAVGPGVSGAIAASTALMAGMPIDQALLEGVKNAIPGGPAAQAAFAVTQAAVSGGNIVNAAAGVALDRLGLPPEAKKIVASALVVAQKAAKGENIPKAALEEARNQLPPTLQKAYDVGIAMGHAKRLQDVATIAAQNIGPQELALLEKAGIGQMTQHPVFQAAKGIVEKTQEQGYKVGLGLMSHSKVAESHIQAIKSKLSEAGKRGFDMAVNAYTGAVYSPPPPSGLSLQGKLTFAITHSLQHAPYPMKQAIVKQIAKTPAGKMGAILANQGEETWLEWFWNELKYHSSNLLNTSKNIITVKGELVS